MIPAGHTHRGFRYWAGFLGLLAVATLTALAPTRAPLSSGFSGTFAHHNDNARTGANLQELVLTPATVNQAQFGKLFACAVDGYVYAQPLYVANLAIPDHGTYNVVFVATEHGSVFAFDADDPTCVQLWMTSVIDPDNGITTVRSDDVLSGDIAPEISITGTA